MFHCSFLGLDAGGFVIVFSTEVSFPALLMALNVQNYLALLQSADLLRADLLALNRILRGTLAAGSKGQLVELLNDFYESTHGLIQADVVLTQVVATVRVHADNVQSTSSNDNGGYITIEREFNCVMNLLGFIKGYLFVKYDAVFQAHVPEDPADAVAVLAGELGNVNL